MAAAFISGRRGRGGWVWPVYGWMAAIAERGCRGGGGRHGTGGPYLASRAAVAAIGRGVRGGLIAGHTLLPSGSASLWGWGGVQTVTRRILLLGVASHSSVLHGALLLRWLLLSFFLWACRLPAPFSPPACVACRTAAFAARSYLYMAPEVVRHTSYSAKADTFSYAILVNEIFSDERPYGHLLPMHAAIGVVKKGLRPSQKRIHNPQLRALLAACWDAAPDKRPDWDTVISTLESLRDAALGPDGKGGGRRAVRASGRLQSLGSGHSAGASGTSGVSRLLRKLAVSGPAEGKRA